MQGIDSEALGYVRWLQTPGVQRCTESTGLHKQADGDLSILTTRGKSRIRRKEEGGGGGGGGGGEEEEEEEEEETGTSPKRRQY